MTLAAISPYTVPAANNDAKSCEYAWGIYRDVDISSSATDLPAYSAGFSNSWMVHKTGTLSQPFLTTTFVGSQVAQVTLGQNDQQYRRYELNLRRYKRVMDSANDTLILSVENNPGLTPGGFQADLNFSFYFRMLLLE